MEPTVTRPAGDWDLTPYFPSPGGPEYQAFRDGVVGDLRALAARLAVAAPLTAATADAWAAWIADLEEASRRFWHTAGYLGCLGAADAEDEWTEVETAAFDALRAELSKLLVGLQAALAAAGEADFAALVARPALAHARFFLTRLRQRATWSMTPAMEALAADLEPDGISAWSRLYDRVSGRLTFRLGGTTEPISRVRGLLEDPDPEVRAAVARGAAEAWAGVADVTAASLNAISGARLTLYRHRGVDDFLAPPLFDAAISRDTLDTLLAVVRARQDVPRRYLALKARILGRPRLGFQDLLAPLPVAAERIPWEEAERLVVEAFSGFYPALGEFARMAFEARWIDHSPRRGKRPGGFCSPSHYLGESRIFLTYDGGLADVATLAHELGHAWHNWVMRDLPAWAAEYPMTLAETASTFAEQLVIDHVLRDPQAPAAARARALDRRMQDGATFLLNIPMRFDFERRLYAERAEGEVSVRRLKAMMEEAQRANYGDALAEEALDPWFWASKLHFYIPDVSFYNFPYTFGYLFSLGIFARAQAEGPGFLPRYEGLLRQTGLDTAEGVARDALGVDLAAPGFWNASIDQVERDLGRFEDISKELFKV